MKTAGACFLLVIVALTTLAQQKPATKVRDTLRVRPLGEVRTLLHGSGLSHKWASFYLAIEEPDGSVKPIQIAYAFYQSNQLPPESFWDYSKIYEVKVQRESGCDVKVESMACVRNVTEGGKELPRSFVLRYAKGAPEGLLKMDAVPPCYVLWYGDYHELEAKSR